ncbi:glycoside hydrolase family 3 C-terminal domain-containing protein [Escherichia coli]
MPKAACTVKKRVKWRGESLVLLKNRLETLPLKKSATIAVVGPLADSKRDVMGSWSAAGVADQSVTVLTGIKNSVW